MRLYDLRRVALHGDKQHVRRTEDHAWGTALASAQWDEISAPKPSLCTFLSISSFPQMSECYFFSFFLITCEMPSTLEWLVGKPRGSKRGRGAVRGRDRWRARTDPRVPLLQVPRASERHDAAEAGSAVERPGVPAQLLRALPRALGGGAWSQAVSTGSSSRVRDGGDQHQRWPN